MILWLALCEHMSTKLPICINALVLIWIGCLQQVCTFQGSSTHIRQVLWRLNFDIAWLGCNAKNGHLGILAHP